MWATRCCRTKIQLCILLSFYSCIFILSSHYHCCYFGIHQKKAKDLEKQGADNIFLPRQAEQNGKANTDTGSGASIADTGGVLHSPQPSVQHP